MEWTRVQHLDLRHVARGQKPQQPHYAAFKSSQAVVAVAVGTHVIGKQIVYWFIIFYFCENFA